MKFIINNSLKILIIIFLIINIFIFFNNGLYWDDWCLITNESISAITKGVGLSFMSPIHIFLMSLNTYQALQYHLIILSLEIISIVLLYNIFRKISNNNKNIFIILLFYIIIPYNESKILISTINYTAGFTVFLLSTYLYISQLYKPNLIFIIISLLLLFLSFALLPSLLVFSLGITFLFSIYNFKERYIDINKFLYNLYKSIDFLLIILLFWIFRLKFLMPTGVYAKVGYRTFTANNIIYLPNKILQSFYDNILAIHNMIPQYFSIFFVFILFLTIFFLNRFSVRHFRDNNKFHILILGIYLFFFATLAYSILGLTPEFGSVNSRHQILIKFAAPFILFYILTLLSNVKYQNIFISFILISSFSYSYSSQLKFQKSWFKQLALERLFKKEKNITNGDNFLIIDNTTIYNEFNGTYSTYNLNGILYKALGNQTHIAIDSKQYNAQNNQIGIDSTDSMMKLIYHVNNVTNFSRLNYTYYINQGPILLTYKQNIKMLYQYYFNKEKFNNSLDGIITLKRSNLIIY